MEAVHQQVTADRVIARDACHRASAYEFGRKCFDIYRPSGRCTARNEITTIPLKVRNCRISGRGHEIFGARIDLDFGHLS